MSAPYPVATEIRIGRISSFLARKESARDALYQWEPLDLLLEQILVMESEILAWKYSDDPSDLTLIPSGWYLYSLCGRFIPDALDLIGSGTGGIIIDPTTNRSINLIGVTTMFTVGDSSTNPLMQPGDTGFVVNDTGVLYDTVAFGYVNSSPLPRTGAVPADQKTYSVAYTPNSITINIVQVGGALGGEQYALTYLRAGAGTVFNPPSGTGLPSQTGHEGEVLFTTGSVAYWRYPSKPIHSSDFDQTDGVTCLNPDWQHNKLVIVWNDLPKVLEPGIDYTLIDGGGFVVTIDGFDARANSYSFEVFLTGKNT